MCVCVCFILADVTIVCPYEVNLTVRNTGLFVVTEVEVDTGAGKQEDPLDQKLHLDCM